MYISSRAYHISKPFLTVIPMNLQDIFIYTIPPLVIFIFLFPTLGARKNKNSLLKSPPEAPRAWPILGHLHYLLGGDKLLHRSLAAMADRCGPTFVVRLGINRVLVVSSWKAAKECFTINDKVFPDRPRSLAVKIMGYEHAMFGFAPYGPYWGKMRKLATVELLSSRRLELPTHVRDRDNEVRIFLRELYELCPKHGHSSVVLDLKEKLGDLAMNIIARMIAGERYTSKDSAGIEESRRCRKALADFFNLAGQFMVSDAIPFLGWLDVMRGCVGQMKRTAKELDYVFGSWVDEHRQRRAEGRIDEAEQDYIHAMLDVLEEDENLSAQEIDTIIKANCLSLILGGGDTTVLTILWILSLLLNNRDALRKAQSELEIHVGMHRQVDESDINNLTYLLAIVKETLRLYPPLPLSVSRIALEDCTVAGFHIPAGTHLCVNLWKLQRNPRIWSDPSEFRPERFLTSHADLDYRGQDFIFIPFGSGRRMCPAVAFFQRVLHLILARLLHGFEIDTVSNSKVDMSEGSGLTLPRTTPLEIILQPRLPSMCYEC